jgi:hypothetical protein
VDAQTRPLWRVVGVPSEHGGWGLTLEPVLLGLLLAPSIGGLALGAAAFLVFLVRTPLKLAVIDWRRDQWSHRSRVALRIALAELGALVVMVAIARSAAGWAWLAPVAAAAPLVAVELWFDVRSRGRRMVPELCGAVGIAAAAAVIVVAGGHSVELAVGAWMVLAARSVAAIPFVRVQIVRLRRGSAATASSDSAQAAGVVIAAVAVFVERAMLGGLVGLVSLALVQVMWVRRPSVAAKVLGMRQLAMGLGLVALTAVGVLV